MSKDSFFNKLIVFITAVHQTTHEFSKNVRTGAITPVQYNILEYIAISQPVTLSEISDCQHMSMPNTSRELKKLVEKNLCEKVTSAEDRRKQYIRLSPEGQAFMNNMFGRMQERLDERMKDLSADELQELEHALSILQDKVFNSNIK